MQIICLNKINVLALLIIHVSNSKKMKTLITLLSFVLLFSCQKKLDLKPQITEQEATNSKENIEKILIGAYGTAFSANCFGGASWQIQEAIAANESLTTWNGTSENSTFYLKNQTATNDKVLKIWQNAYNAVNACNLVIASSEKNLVAEAKFLRAYIFTELMRLYAVANKTGDELGIPLPLTPTKSYLDNAELSRKTNTEVWVQINKDLADALLLLPETNSPMRATKLTATALLARTSMYAGDMREAAKYASEVISSGKYKLEAEPLAIFGQEIMSEEVIFAVYAPASTKEFLAFRENELYFGKQYLAQFVGRDRRQEYFRATATKDVYKSMKYSTLEHFIPVIRLAEMYLIRAEANFAVNTSIGSAPLNDINVVRNRVRASGIGTITKEVIENERLLELDFEGHRLFDLKRYKRNISLSIAYNAPKLVLPIPAIELQNNKNMQQNVGY